MMEDVFVFVHPHNSLDGLVAIFEGALLRFNERLIAKPRIKQQNGYKELLDLGL